MPLQSPPDDYTEYSRNPVALHRNLQSFDWDSLCDVDCESDTDPWSGSEIDDLLDAAFESPRRRSNEVTAAPPVAPKSHSNKVTAPKRGTDARDKQIIGEIQEIRFSQDEAGRLSLVGNFPTLSTTSYEHSNGRLTLTMANLSMHVLADVEAGTRVVSWSLNLSPEREGEALRHRDGFVGCLSRYIGRALERGFGKEAVPLYLFAGDVEKGRLHLHGATLLRLDQISTFRQALMEAGGKIKGRAEVYQFHCDPDRCDDGWIKYPLRNRKPVRDLIGERMVFVSKRLRVEAKWTYGKIREIIKADNIDAALFSIPEWDW